MIAQIDPDYLDQGMARVMRRIISYVMFEGRPQTSKGRFIKPSAFDW
jgi:hypothetical protein